MEQFNSTELNFIFEIILHKYSIGLMIVGSKRRYQNCSDNSGTILYLRALQGHSGSNLIDPTSQDNVVIVTGIFLYVYHVGSSFNLHSIIRNGLVLGGQNFEQKTNCVLLTC